MGYSTQFGRKKVSLRTGPEGFSSNCPRGFEKLWELERHHPRVHCRQGVEKILIKRIVSGIDAESRRAQAGFRKRRSATEQRFALKNIVEQVVKSNSSFYL